MNKIFKTKRSRKFDTVAVVSELASNHRNQSEVSLSVIKALLAIALGGVVSTSAFAYEYVQSAYNNITIGNNNYAKNSVLLNPAVDGSEQAVKPANAVEKVTILGYGAQSRANGGTAIGFGTLIDDPSLVDSVVLGEQSQALVNPYALSTTNNESGQAVALGSKAIATAQATAVGNDVYAIGRSSIALGSDDIMTYRDKVSAYDFEHYFKKLYQKIDPTGTKYGFGTKSGEHVSWNTDAPNPTYGNLQTVYSPTLAQGDGAIAIGSRSLAYDAGTTALGTLAFALGKGSTAVGTQTRAEGVGSIALGNQTSIFADNSVGAGNEIQILNKGGMAYGYKSYSAGENSIAIGSNVYSNTKLDTSVQKDGHAIFGSSGYLGADLDAIAQAASKNSSLTKGQFFTGSNSYLEQLEALVSEPTTIKAVTAEKNGVADVIQQQGDDSGKKAKNAIVIGSNSAAIGDNSIAFGRGAFALENNGFALGSYSYSDSDSAMAVGLASHALGQNSIAFGVGTGTDKTAKDSLAIGTGSLTTGANTTLVGNNSRIWSENSGLFGYKSSIFGDNNLAVGNQITIGNKDELGSNLLAFQPKGNSAFGNKIFIRNNVSESVAIGTSARIGKQGQENRFNLISHAMALGYNAVVEQNTNGSHETGTNAIALGSYAKATLDNSIAIGYQSLTDYGWENLEKNPWVMPGAIGIPTSGKTGVVSVGSRNQERRIVNLASGALDTDAVNVGQLRMVADRLNLQIDEAVGGGTRYVSVNRTLGQAGQLENLINLKKNYELYVGLKSRQLSYKARQQYNGEQFNAESLQVIDDKLQELAARNPEFVNNASQLNNIEITGPAREDKHTFDEVMRQINAAEIADKSDQKIAQLTEITPEELQSRIAKANYSNLGAKGAESIALGFGAQTDADKANAIAIGFNAHTTAAQSIALGANALAESDGKQGIAYGGASIEGATPTDNAVLSIGHDTFNRRIKHVAAGADPTDAVNVSQLASLANNKVHLIDSTGQKTAAQTLGQDNGVNFTIKGADANISTSVDGSSLSLALNKVLTGMESITGKGTTLTFNNDGVDLGGKRLQNVGKPTAETDAANMAYVNAQFAKAANKDLSNLTDPGKAEIRKLATSSLAFESSNGSVHIEPSGSDIAKTYNLTVDETRLDAQKLKDKIGVTYALTDTQPDNNSKLVTAGAVNNAINSLKSGGFTVSAEKGAQTTVGLGKNLAIVGDGTTIDTAVNAQSEGAEVRLSLNSAITGKINDAHDNALAAKEVAQNASQKAQEANNTAANALDQASEAVQQSQAAQNTANEANQKANEANTQSGQALNQANAAKSESATANTMATQALEKANQGWTLAAPGQSNGEISTQIVAGNKVTLNAGKNTTVSLNDKTVTFGLIDSPVFEGKVSANGFDANHHKIENVADATVDSDVANLKTVKDTIAKGLASFSTDLVYTANSLTESLKVDLKKGLNFVSNNPEQLTIEAKEEGQVAFGLNTANNASDISNPTKLATAGAVKAYVDEKVGSLSPTIAYKAGDDTQAKTVALTEGLTFKSSAGSPVKVSAEDNGVINVNVDVASSVNGEGEAKKLVTAEVAKNYVDSKLGDSYLKFAGDIGEANVGLNNTVTIKGGASETQLTDNNIGVIAESSGTLNVKLAKDLKQLDSVSVGADNADRTVITSGSVKVLGSDNQGPSLTKDGLNNGGKVLSNIADGVHSNDAATVKQVNDARDANKEAAQSIADALGLEKTQPEGTQPTYKTPTFDKVVSGAMPDGSAPKTFKDAVNQLTSAVNAGLTFAADEGAPITRHLGQTLKFTANQDKNLSVKAENEKIAIELSKTPTFEKVTLADQTNAAPQANEAVSGGYLKTQLDELNKSVTGNAHLKVVNNGQNEKSVALSSQSLDFKNGKNTTVTVGEVTDNLLPITVDVNSNLTGITSIAASNGTDSTGAKITLSSGPDKIVSLNEAKLTGLQNGTVAEHSQDAVTGDQLNAALKAVKDVLGDSAKIENGTLTKNPDTPSVSDSLKSKLSTITVAAQSGSEATLDPSHSKLTINGQKDQLTTSMADHVLTIALANAIKGIESVEVGASDGAHSTLTNDGLTIKPASGNEVHLTSNGLDNGGHKLTNIASGVEGTDAVNVNQLNSFKGNNKEALETLGNALGLNPKTAENGKTTFDTPHFDSVKNGAGETTPSTVMGALQDLTHAVNAGLGFTVGETNFKRQLGQNVAFAPMADGVNGASGKNVKLSADANSGTINVGFSDTPTFKKVTLDPQSQEHAPADNEAVSGGYLNTKLDELNKTVTGNANLKVAGNDDEATSLKLSTQTLNFKNGKNTTVTVSAVNDNKLPVTVNLDADLKGITSIAGGDNDAGAKISLSNNGDKTVTLNDAKLTGLAQGEVASMSKDAVTGDQLNTALDSIKKLFGDAVQNQNGLLTPTNPDDNSGIGGTGEQTIGGAIATKLTDFSVEGDQGNSFKVNNKTETNKLAIKGTEHQIETSANDGNVLNVKLASDIQGINTVTVGPKDGISTRIAGDGLTISPDAGTSNETISLTKDGLNNGNKKITNVAAGSIEAGSHDVVTGSQLFDVKTKLDSKNDDLEKVLGLTSTNGDDGQNGRYQLDIPAVVNGQNGTNATPAQATTITDVLKQLTTAVNKGLTFAGDEGSIVKHLGDTLNVKTGQPKEGFSGTNLETKVDQNGVTIGLSDTPTFTKVTLGDQLNGNTPKEDLADTDASSVGYVKNQVEDLKKNLTAETKLSLQANGSDDQELVLSQDKFNIVNGKNTTARLGKDGQSVKVAFDVNSDLEGITSISGPAGADKKAVMTFKGGAEPSVALNDVKLTGLANGKLADNSTDAVTGKQLDKALTTLKDALGKDFTYDPENGTITGSTSPEGIGGTGKQTIGEAIASKLTGFKVTGDADDVTTTIDNDHNTLAIKGTPNQITSTVDSQTGKVTLALANDLSGFNSIALGSEADQPHTVLGKNGLTITSSAAGATPVSLTQSGLNNGGNKITNVGKGAIAANSTDAVTGSQLFDLENKVNAGNKNLNDLLGYPAGTAPQNDWFKPITVGGENPSTIAPTTVKGAIDGLTETLNKGLTFAADTGKNVVRHLGDTVGIKTGTIETDYVGTNITTDVQNGNVIIGFKDTPTFKKVILGNQLDEQGEPKSDLQATDASSVGYVNKSVTDLEKKLNDGAKLDFAVDGTASSTLKLNSGKLNLKNTDNVTVAVAPGAGTDNKNGVDVSMTLNSNLKGIESIGSGNGQDANDGVRLSFGPNDQADKLVLNDKVMTGLANGSVAADSKDAVTGGQLHSSMKDVKDVLGNDFTLSNDGKLALSESTKGDAGIGGTGQKTLSEAIGKLNDNANKGWKLKVEANGGEATALEAGDVINPDSNELTFVAGKDIVLTQEKGKLTIATNNQAIVNGANLPVKYVDAAGNQVYAVKGKDGISFNSQADGKGKELAADQVSTAINGVNGAATTLGNVKSAVLDNDTTTPEKYIEKLTSTKPVSNTAAEGGAKSEDVIGNNHVATTEDLKNIARAGIQLQANGEAAKTLGLGKPLKVEDGLNTKVKISQADNGMIKFTVDVNGMPMAYVNADGETLAKVGDNYYVLDKQGALKMVDGKPVPGTIAGMKLVNNVPTKLTNVAAGSMAKDSNDAVNGGQLQAVLGEDIVGKDGTQKQTVSAALKAAKTVVEKADDSITVTSSQDDNTKATVYKVAVNEEHVHKQVKSNKIVLKNEKSGDDADDVTLSTQRDPRELGGHAMVQFDNRGQSVRLHGVADGVEANDAATVGQVNRALTATNSRIDQNRQDIMTMRREYRGGIASAGAMASLPQPYRPGQNAISMAGAHYKGMSALAIGASSISENGHYIFKVNASIAPGNNSLVGAGFGYIW